MKLIDSLFIMYGMNLPGSMKEGEISELAKEHGNEYDYCAAYCCKWDWKLSATAKVLWLQWLRRWVHPYNI